MKKTIRSLCKILLLVVLLIAACKPNPKETLSRKWKPVDASGEGITEEMKEDIINEGVIIEFTKGGGFNTYVPGEKPENGAYTLSSDGKMVNVRSTTGREVQMEIKELSIRKLIIENHGLILIMEPVK